jgi:hypothetical protein
MKTLFERLKSKHLEKLNHEALSYPKTIEYIINDLKKNKFIDDLTYKTVYNLQLILADYQNVSFLDLYNLFEHDLG